MSNIGRAFAASDCGAFIALAVGAGMRSALDRAEFVQVATSTWDAVAEIVASAAKDAAADAAALKSSAIPEINKGDF
jgi:hypothetical protein